MKKIVGGIAVLTTVVCGWSICVAQNNQPQNGQHMPGTTGMKKGMGGMMGGMMCGRADKQGGHGDMGAMMMQMDRSQLVATNDGGVVVLHKNNLMKFDKNLNLVKEKEIFPLPDSRAAQMRNMPNPDENMDKIMTEMCAPAMKKQSGKIPDSETRK